MFNSGSIIKSVFLEGIKLLQTKIDIYIFYIIFLSISACTDIKKKMALTKKIIEGISNDPIHWEFKYNKVNIFLRDVLVSFDNSTTF